MRPLILLLLLNILLCPNGNATNIHFQTLGSVHGLSQSSAISIWQDRLGRMWFGNDALNCYDGETVKVYRLSDYFEGVEDSNLHTITGNDSLLFVVAERRVFSFDFQQERFEQLDMETLTVYCENDCLYYFSSGIFYKYHIPSRVKEEIMPLDPKVAIVRQIEKQDENRFILATPVGAYVVDVALKKQVDILLPAKDLAKILWDSHNRLWLTTRSNEICLVSELHTESRTMHWLTVEDESFRGSAIYSMVEDVNGTVWLGTLSGIYQIKLVQKPGGYHPEVLNHVMNESTVFALYRDRQGTLWIGSYYGDIKYFNPKVDDYLFFQTDENHPDRLHGAVIGDMAEDKNGNLYIITEGSGINIFNHSTGQFKHLKAGNGLRQNKVRSVWYDEHYDRLFFGEYMNGMSCYERKTGRVRHLEKGELSTLYQQIIEDIQPYQNYLILMTQNGLFRLDRETLGITRLFDDPSLAEACSGIIRAIHVADNGILWVSSYTRGLFTIDLKTNRMEKSYGDGLSKGSVIPSAVIGFAEHPQKGLFLSTMRSGVMYYDTQADAFKPITARDQLLLSDICYKMVFTRYGNLVVTTNKGISVVNISARKVFSAVHHFRLSSSFPLEALSGDCGLFFSPRDNLVYVGGLYGLFAFSEEKLGIGSNHYSLYFSSLRINNELQTPQSGVIEKSLPYTGRIVLPYHKNTLNLTFASTNYLSTRNSWHEYKMEGLEDLWTQTNHKDIIFNSLRPGKYNLMIREVGNESKQATLSIVINPPFWATVPAIAFYVSLLLIILWAIMRFNKGKALLKASLEVERKELQRIEEANRIKMDFFINVSNEFRTPLTLIISQLERLTYELPSKNKKRLEKIHLQTNRLQDLITELLDFRKMENNSLLLHVANCNLNDFLKKIFVTYADVAEERQIRYKYRQLTESVDIWMDKKQMQKVIYNLLTFAFKYAQLKTSIELVVQVRNRWAEIQLVYDGEMQDDESVEYLFQLINEEQAGQTDLSFLPEGGMGIAFSRGIVALHRGRFSVTSEERKIYYMICLPLGNSHFSHREMESVPELVERDVWVESTGERTEPEEVVAEDFSQEKRMSLLLVEPDDEIRSLLKESFSFNYHVTQYIHASDAYKHAVSEQPDLIITEVNIPDMNGMEFFQMLKSNVKTLHIPLVVLSSQPSEKQKTDCVRNGADVYMVKPFNLDFLLLRCNALVKYRQKMLQQSVAGKKDKAMFDISTNLRDKKFMSEANLLIEKNIGNPDFDTTYWSKEMGIGRTRLFSQIKSITGMTPNDYILHLKMNKAIALLEESHLTIAEIAYQLGFSIPAYFSKCFKKQFGITPAEYRKTKDA